VTSALSVIVLAGGQSSRMGQDKALIPINGVPLLRRTCETALQCANQVWVVTARSADYRTIAPPACQFILEESVGANQFPQGPLVGFAQGLVHCTTPWVLLLACDLPYLQASILQRWQQQLPGDDGAIALLPHSKKGWEPLCGFYHRRCLESLNAYLQNGGRSFQTWLNEMPVQPIAFHPLPDLAQQEAQMLFNCNTPSDLNWFQQQAQ
jgi:molybdopterin-guanine dinucleotide biosynthesis protein A